MRDYKEVVDRMRHAGAAAERDERCATEVGLCHQNVAAGREPCTGVRGELACTLAVNTAAAPAGAAMGSRVLQSVERGILVAASSVDSQAWTPVDEPTRRKCLDNSPQRTCVANCNAKRGSLTFSNWLLFIK